MDTPTVTDLTYHSWGARPLENTWVLADTVFRYVARYLSTREARIRLWNVDRIRLDIFYILVHLRRQNFVPGCVVVALFYLQEYSNDCFIKPLVPSSEAEQLFMGALVTAIYWDARPRALPDQAIWRYSSDHMKSLRKMWQHKMDPRHLNPPPQTLKAYSTMLLEEPGHSIIDGDLFPTFQDAEMLDVLKIPKLLHRELKAEEIELAKAHSSMAQSSSTTPPLQRETPPKRHPERTRSIKFNIRGRRKSTSSPPQSSLPIKLGENGGELPLSPTPTGRAASIIANLRLRISSTSLKSS
ncbi:hypothetical protein DFP72DRAFT_898978 [Ephemerocybe angulata]|uniref:Uncharacterized protein n=1 Tax=Ephemerocybe angulata TaxID=980116 RepID=A0A8H6HXN7_9AGAR|nr:hypothetical protein DFP72DRAFT_898978 [Tulosesus angulatus]